MKTTLSHIIAIAALLLAGVPTGNAFTTTHFTKNSKLASGKWVKIAVSKDGVYEITDAELAEMGFSNPANVQIYGQGGYMIGETLSSTLTDDLIQVRALHANGKLCFYAQGTTEMTLNNLSNVNPNFTHKTNAYSTHGYYFLTEGSGSNGIDVAPLMSTGTTARNSCLAWYHHDNDLTSVSMSGKQLLGENIGTGTCTLPFSLPGNVSNTVVVNVNVGVKSSDATTILTTLTANGQDIDVNYTSGQNTVVATTLDNTYYTMPTPAPLAFVNTNQPVDSGNINIRLFSPANGISLAKMDYFTMTYTKSNDVQYWENNQSRLDMHKLLVTDRIVIPGATENTVAWLIQEPDDPLQYPMTPEVDSLGNVTGYSFTPGSAYRWGQFVAFDPTGTLMKIDGFEPVENQNLHGMEAPDMLIITIKDFIPQAERIAKLHKDVEGLDVAVVDQQQVFNEFSSGTPDAMAYRLLCKMLYDRNSKFKNLLLLGGGSYDNRGIISNRPNRLITYQSDASNDYLQSYTSDDFFGFLDDNSGSASTMFSDKLRIGVGRIPSSTIEEAKSDIDKLIKYVTLPDYGPWRNDNLVISDTGDNDLHIFQSEGITEQLEGTLNTHMQTNKVYVELFQPSLLDNKTASEARRRMVELLTNGQYFSTYIGHAGPLVITKSNLYTNADAQRYSYPHLPIMTTAACEVARFDSDQRGVAEYMFHQPNGGAIAMLTSTRPVLSDQNHIMNQTFIKNFFTWNASKKMNTLGETYMATKQGFGSSVYCCKLAYTLLGDPLIKINYPKPLFNITSVNGSNVAQASVDVTSGPMQQITVNATVTKADGSIDTSFNGDGTISLYGPKKFLKTTPAQREKSSWFTRDVYYPRDIIASIGGRVVNGILTATVTVPRSLKATGDTGLLRVYAHRDNSDEMVNGECGGIMLEAYNDSTALSDDQAPTIDAMFLNDEAAFSDGATVPANSTLYIKATDDLSINTSRTSIGDMMKLLLDGGKTSYNNVKEFASAIDDGQSLSVRFPLENLSEGPHTLTFTVFDVAGNSATRTISFAVGQTSNLTISAEELTAVESARISLDSDKLSSTPEACIKVTDAQGHIVWKTNTSTGSTVWPLTDMNGQRVAPGLYKFYATYDNGTEYGGTNIGDIIVIEPLTGNDRQ